MTPEQCAEVHGRAVTRRAARHALWRAGDLRYLLHSGRDPHDPLLRMYPEGFRIDEVTIPERRGQLHAYDMIHRLMAEGVGMILLKTGRQWGKSLLFVVLFAEMCLRRCIQRMEWDTNPVGEKPEALRIPYAAQSGKQVDEFITPHFDMLRDQAPPELAPRPEGLNWIFPDGSRILVAGCEDKAKANRLRGPRAHAAALDEAGFVPIAGYVIKSVLGDQLLTTGGPMLIASTPPEEPDHVFVDLWADAKRRGHAFESTTIEAPHMTEALLAKAVERKGGIHTVDARRELFGLIIADPKQQVFPEFTEANVGERERPEHFHPYVVGDHGYVDLCVLAFGYYDFAADLDVIEAEIVLSHATSDRIDAEVRAMERRLWGDLPVKLRAIDATPQVRADMSAARFQSIEVEEPPTREEVFWGAVEGEAVRATGPEVLYWQPVRKDDKHAAVNGARLRLGQRRVLIHPRCVTIRAHAEYARWNKARTDFERPASAEHHYDGAAALVYFLRMLDRQTNPMPRLPERPEHVSEDDWMIDPTVERREAAKRGAFTGRRSRRRR